MPAPATYKWLVNRTNPEYVDYVARVASVPVPLAQVLINRGLKSAEQLDTFLRPSLQKLSDPFDLPGMADAVARIMEARRRGSRVFICGDYDADGVSATAIMVEMLGMLEIECGYFIPNRIAHGYGFGREGIDAARRFGADLIITVDCGISAFETVAEAAAAGMDVIVTDHHEPGSHAGQRTHAVPAAVAVVNPKLLPDETPLKHLCGAGVAFKLAQALFDNRLDDLQPLLDLAAIGTAADVVPLIGDNRIFVREGLKLIQSNQRVGIRALKAASGIRPDYFKSSFLPFLLIPRINAAGRVDDAGAVVRLLTTRSEDEASECAQWLQTLNSRRQEVEEVVFSEAQRQLTAQAGGDGPIILAGEGWHPGVLGIVASRIAERYYRPVFVFALEDGIAKGSARSIPPFNLYEALCECSALLKRFGGHRQAAGLALAASDIDEFRQRIAQSMEKKLTADDFVRVIEIDAALQMSDITYDLVHGIMQMEPFGYGNAEPIFGCRGLEPANPRIVGNNHLKMSLRGNGRGVDSIGFDFGGFFDMVESGTRIDAAFVPVINEWEGGRSIQLNLKAIRPAL
ncbi:MAG TPA: single-stranded-DNA-specific exonuclease RecJ [Dissulfurispiraceae bacterium]|nr:single-stranded-DNA-specific exonuclease RecJ [Dissulfurispiraceae bacterium]